MSLRSFPFVFTLLLAFAVSARALDWTPQPGAGTAAAAGATLQLELSAAGETGLTSKAMPVVANARMGLSFTYTAANLSSDVRFFVAVRWLDVAGKNIDDQRLQLGFPPAAREWSFSRNAKEPVTVGDNLSVPSAAASAVLVVRLERAEKGQRAATVAITDLALLGEEVAVSGLDVAASGPVDAGPLSAPPAGKVYAANLVPNGAFEDGEQTPTGWQIEGDNSKGAAIWQDGGAFSGRRALKVADRGPYVKSWDEPAGGVYVPGGKPGGNYAGAREEASARWVSEPMPATPGTLYQATAFLWYANRQYLDRGNVNPVRIQFLDAKGKVLPYVDQWQDWLPNTDPFQIADWVLVLGRPVIAPPTAVSVRTAVVMFHAFYDMDGGLIRKRPDDRGFVLVDNVSLYQIQTEQPIDLTVRDPIAPDQAFWDTAAAGGLPFVATSAEHRPNTLSVESDTGYPGGILFADADAEAAETATAGAAEGEKATDLALGVTNWLGDVQTVTITYTIFDLDNTPLNSGTVAAEMPPFSRQRVLIERPAALPLGPYLIRYTLLQGDRELDRGETRFAMMRKHRADAAERGRQDYPFGLWNHRFRSVIDTPAEAEMGRIMETAGMGKTWFGCGGGIYLSHYVTIKDPVARREAIEKRLVTARQAIAGWRRYGVTPMGHLECPHLMDPADYPILDEVVTAFVDGLKGEITNWRYGTESMHGGVKELDLAKVPVDAKNGQGGSNYLYWGREGTVRQYWAEYFVAYAAAHRADPMCSFGPQVASDIEGDVLRLFFQVGTPAQIDSFGMNTYISAFAIWPPNLVELQKAGVPELPIFVSEFAAQAECSPTGPQHLAEERDAVRRMVTYWTSTLAAFPTFSHLEQWGMILGDDNGSLTFQKRVRPQYVAYAAMTDMLGAGKFTARYDIPQGIVHVRQRSVRQGPVAVMWSTGPEATAELEVGVPTVTLVDVMGNRRALATVDGVAVVPLTPMPQYLEGAAEIKPARTVKLTVAHATEDPQRPRIRVTIANERQAELSGTLTLIPESAVKLSPASYPVEGLRAGESRSFLFDVTPLEPMRDQRLPMRLRFSTANRTYEAVDAPNFHVATRATVAPTIDGDLADWPTAFPLVSARQDQFYAFTSPKTWEGPADLSGRVWLRWDERQLYVAARVTDDVLAFSDLPGREFGKDSIEVLFDMSRGRSKDAPFQMITIAGFEGGKPQVRRYDGPLPKGEVTRAQVAVVRDGGDTVYEAAIPWSELSADFTPRLGEAITMAVTFDDHDGGNSGRRCMSWFSLVSDKNPAVFGDVIFTDDAEPRVNLLRNGDFEDPTLPPGAKMEDWRLWTDRDMEPNATASLVTEGAYAGRSLRIDRLHGKGNMSVGDWTIPVKPGEVYLFRAKVKATERQAIAWLNPVGANGKTIEKLAWIKPLTPGCEANYGRSLALVFAKVAERDAFQPMEGIFEIPPGAAKLQITLSYSWSNGYALFDDCELYLLRHAAATETKEAAK